VDNPKLFQISYWADDNRRHSRYELALDWQKAVLQAGVNEDKLFFVKEVEDGKTLNTCYQNAKLVAKFLDFIGERNVQS
jgi:hypothetical protein